MRQLKIERSEVRTIWKHFPIRVFGQAPSTCCNKDTLLVRSMEGGFVTRNCSACGTKAPLPEADFRKKLDLWVSCPTCKTKMQPEVIEKNYGYLCQGCEVWLKLADLLPHWDDL